MLRHSFLGLDNSMRRTCTLRKAMRIDSVVSLLFLLAGLAATQAVSQAGVDPGASNSHALISTISVAGGGDSVEVEVTFTKLVRAEVSTLAHPDRLVFDFPGCELANPGQRLMVNRGSVVAVRAAVFSVAPPIARLVIDLKSAQDYEEAYAGNKLTIKLKLAGSAQHLPPPSGAHNPPANDPPLAPESDRAAPKSLAAAPSAAVQLYAYALLAKARALTIADLEPLETRAQAGDLEAETMLALAYHAGTLLKMDDAKALRLLQQAASRSFVAAEEAIGIFCQVDFGMPPDKIQAVSWYTKAAQHGSKDAATNLALMYSIGDGIQKDAAKA